MAIKNSNRLILIGEHQKDLNNLSKEELIKIISQQKTKRHHNKIEVADFSVETTEELKLCEETINRLISKHSNFAKFRREKSNLESSHINSIGMI